MRTVILSLLLAIFAFGQNPTAQLTGTVTDVSGATVPGTKLQITNVDTGVALQTESNADGVYVFPVLPPGNYRLSAIPFS
jgi:hypothetical protein